MVSFVWYDVGILLEIVPFIVVYMGKVLCIEWHGPKVECGLRERMVNSNSYVYGVVSG